MFCLISYLKIEYGHERGKPYNLILRPAVSPEILESSLGA